MAVQNPAVLEEHLEDLKRGRLAAGGNCRKARGRKAGTADEATMGNEPDHRDLLSLTVEKLWNVGGLFVDELSAQRKSAAIALKDRRLMYGGASSYRASLAPWPQVHDNRDPA
jgi:hypothetical protein